MIISDGEKVTFDKDAAYKIVAELCDWFDLDVVTKSTVRNPKDTIAELWQEIQILKRELKRASQKPERIITINRLVSKWCNPLISYQEILIFQGKFPSFNKTETFHEQIENNYRLLLVYRKSQQDGA